MSAFYAARLALLVARPASTASEAQAPGPLELAPLIGLAVASVALGLLWLPGAGDVVERLTGGGLAEAAAWELPVSLAALALAGGAAATLAHRQELAPERPGAVAGWAAGWFGLPSVARVVVVDPVLGLTRVMAAFDDRVVDAGVRTAVAVAAGTSRLLAGVAELNVDRIVRGVAGGWLAAARASRHVDDSGVDAAVEGIAGAIVTASARGRRLQGGLSHQYYLLVAVGALFVLAVAVLGSA